MCTFRWKEVRLMCNLHFVNGDSFIAPPPHPVKYRLHDTYSYAAFILKNLLFRK